MPFYTPEAIAGMASQFATIDGRAMALVEAYLTRTYKSTSSLEFAQHGFSRRLTMIARCLQKVFGFIPPELDTFPSEDAMNDATVHIQAFVFNSFGAIDNLAWIWVAESGLTRANGSPLPATLVGLGPKCEPVRKSLSLPFQERLNQLGPWFVHLEDFRHALAHRIPLYTIPYVVPEENIPRYQALDGPKWAAFRDPLEYGRLKREQRALSIYQPIMKHTHFDEKPPVKFHSQLLVDFATVEDIAGMMVAELDSLPPRPVST